MEKALSELIGQTIGKALVFSLVHAVFLRAAAQWVVKIKVPYGKAYGLTFLIAVVGGMFATFFGFAFAHLPLSQAAFMIVNLSIATCVVIAFATGVYGVVLKTPDGQAIGIKKGLFTALVHMALVLAIIGVLFLIVILVGTMAQ